VKTEERARYFNENQLCINWTAPIEPIEIYQFAEAFADWETAGLRALVGEMLDKIAWSGSHTLMCLAQSASCECVCGLDELLARAEEARKP
jgi:hypothetical protein